MSPPKDLEQLTPEQKRELLKKMLKGRRAEVPQLVPVPRDGELPASFAQERMWFLDQLEPGSAAYNVPGALRLTGALDVGALESALNALVARHEPLRTTFAERQGRAVQRIAPPAPVDLRKVDLSRLEPEARAQSLERLVREDMETGFDLDRGPVIRFALVVLGPDEHVLLMSMHHIVTDGWSAGLIGRELDLLYRAARAGTTPDLPPLTLQYADYAQWQRAHLSGEVLEGQLAYWRAQLADAPVGLELPTDRPRPEVQTHAGAWWDRPLSPELSGALRALAQREGVTLSILLDAAFRVVVHRWSGQEDIVLGTPVAGRGRTELEPLVGLFINTLALRTQVGSHLSFRELLGRVKETALGAYAHQDVPFEKLVEVLAPARDLSRSPFFQVMFEVQRDPGADARLGDLKVEPVEVKGAVTAKFDLTVTVLDDPRALAARFEFNTDLFDRERVEALGAGWVKVLEEVVRRPEARLYELPVGGESAELSAGRGEEVAVWGGSFAEKFAEVATARGDAPAVRCGAETLTYAALLKRARGCGEALREAGVKEESLVALLGQRGAGLVTAILGVWEAGGAYLPLDPEHPAKRVRQILEGSGASVVVVGEGERALLDEALAGMEKPPAVLSLEEVTKRERQEGLGVKRARQALAYVIYTSGSTGEPKGVMVEEEGMVNHLEAKVRELSLGAGEVVAQNASQCFDISVWQMLVGLWVGGVTEVLGKEEAASPRGLMEVVEERGVTVLEVVPSMLKAMVEEVEGGKKPGFEKLRWLVATGEALSPQTCGRWLEEYPGIPVVNAYGPTECSDDVTHAFLREAPKGANAPVGKALPNLQTWVLGKELEVMPVGVPGELHVGGVGVGRGYLGRPDLTAERFVPDPYGEPGARLYRTGDLVKRLADGSVEYLGRVDHQVKVRGFRIELGEIEKVLGKVEGVKDCVVVALGEGGDKQLVGYVVGEADANDVKAALRERLPEYMVPSAVVRLEALPLTANGKVDRKKLPAPEGGVAAEYVAPRSPLEELVAGIWARVLKLERVGATDNFFELGGHSLLATQVVSRLKEEFNVTLPIRALFEAPTVGQLAARIRRAGGEAAPVLPPITASSSTEPPPLSFAQERLWFLDQLDPGGSSYNVPSGVRLRGALDVARLERAFRAVVARHEILRTRFLAVEGRPVQDILADPPLPFVRDDLSGLPPAEREATLQRLVDEDASLPFDLAAAPPLRVTCIRMGEADHALVVTMHHVLTDGWSTGVFFDELSRFYALAGDGAPEVTPLPLQYGDYARWQREHLDGDELERQLGYWRQALDGAPAALELATDHPRPPVQTSNGAFTSEHPLPPELEASLRALAQKNGCTLFMVLEAVFHLLMFRYTGQEDVSVGTPIAGRNQLETEALIGVFINTLVLRVDAGGQPTFREFLGRVRAAALGAYGHQDVPFERLVEALHPQRDLARSPLFQVLFSFQNVDTGAAFPGLAVQPLDAGTRTSKFELSLQLFEDRAGIRGMVEYNTDLFERETVERLFAHYLNLLREVVRDAEQRIDALPLTSADERAHLLEAFNATGQSFPPPRPLHAFFLEQVARTPEAVALVDGERALTYRELADRANRLAQHLRGLGVGPEVLVGVCLRRTWCLPVALLAVLEAGGAYVPLDPTYPVDRLSMTLEDSGARFLLTESGLRGLIPAPSASPLELDLLEPELAARPVQTLEPWARAENLAYVIYTSGSTGRPKGVAISHASGSTFLHWVRQTFSPEELAGVLFSTSVCFDLSIFELFGPLAWGGKVILADNALHLPTLPAKEEVRLINTVPSAMAELIRLGAVPQSVRTVNLAGEALLEPLVLAVFQAEQVRRLCNLYGPTEDTTYSTFTSIPRTDRWRPTIGAPLSNSQVFLLDRHLEPVPRGVAGEICIAGEGLARGYLARPELTAERFIPNPFARTPGERLYRTGDLGRYRASGEIEYLGRLDHQVKIRGFRIELGEIETSLLRYPGVQEAVVVAREDVPGDKRLVAYVAPGAQLSAAPLRAHLGKTLPEHMIPSGFVLLDALPRTANGKVDRKQLPAPVWEASVERFVAPRTPMEELLASIWMEVLHLDRVGVEDDFFELGGHSLLATQLGARVRARLGVELPVRAVFEHPTVARLAAQLQRQRVGGRGGELPPVSPREPGRSELPLSFSQERLWFLDQLSPGESTYNVPLAARLRGALQVEALQAAIDEVVARHEILRTCYPARAGQPYARVEPPGAFPLPLRDLSALPAAEREEALTGLLREVQGAPFSLTEGPVFRALLIRLAADEHVLALATHHIATDGWSTSVLLEEVSRLYEAKVEGHALALPPVSLQYGDFALWQRTHFGEAALEAELGYWKEQLGGELAPLELPTDRPRPPVKGQRGGLTGAQLPKPLLEKLKALSRREGVTLFMALEAAYAALLHRLTGQRDLCVGTAVAGRELVQAEAALGFFVNTVVLRTSCAPGDAFRAVLARVKEAALGAYAHQAVPFERLVDALRPERDLSRTPIFQTLFVLQNAPAAGRTLAGLRVEPLPPAAASAKFDLTLGATETDDGLELIAEYDAELFDAATVERWLGHYRVLLEAVAEDPSRTLASLELLDAAGREAVARASNLGARGAGGDTLHRRFEAQARKTPEAPALIGPEGSRTYAELDRRADALAARLRAEGAGPERLVGVALPRGFAAIETLLAVLKTGAAYVPIDPAYPADRIAWLVSDSQVPLVVTTGAIAPRLPDGAARILRLEALDEKAAPIAPSAEVHPASAAYVIYTSGSTGRPKGVVVPHGAIGETVNVSIQDFCTGPGTRTLQNASLSFDVSACEIFSTLLGGGALVVVPEEGPRVGEALAESLRQHRVTTLCAVPQVFESLEPGTLPELKVVVTGGEPCSAALKNRWAPGRRFVTAYGPTECAVNASTAVCPVDARAPNLGRALPHVSLRVLDSALALVPFGVAGELYIAGAAVSRGYLGRPGLTAERFLPDPFAAEPGARMYRTGDRARLLPDGTFEFLGRLDEQVKVRGHRIELGELRAVLEAFPGVERAVVAVRQTPAGPALAGYVVGGQVDLAGLRGFVAERVPGYMVPAGFARLDEVPLTPNGKVDLAALPEPTLEAAADDRAPAGEVEEPLAAIWCEVLGLPAVGAERTFFELGGHSLLATQVIARIQKVFGVELPVRALFEDVTVARLARRIAAAAPGAAGPALAPRSAELKERAPLSFAQERLWFLDQLEPGSAAYNVPTALRLRGELKVEALERAFALLFERHEVLRTTIEAERGAPVQRIHPPQAMPLPVVDLAGLLPEAREAEVLRAVDQEESRGFDLEKGPLLRLKLLRLDASEHVLLMTMHHLVTDGWSMGIFIDELQQAYEAALRDEVPAWAPLPVQYADYAQWQRAHLTGEVLEGQLAYWRAQLADAPVGLELATDRPRPEVQTYAGARVGLAVPPSVVEAAERLARAEGCSLFMVLDAAFRVVLHRSSGQEDIVLGTPVAGRSRTELEPMVGLFINTLALRTQVGSHLSFRELLGRVKETALGAYAHQDVPFEKLVEVLAPARDLSRSPFFQVMFELQNAPRGRERALPGLTVSAIEGEGVTAKFDLTVTVYPGEPGLGANFEFNTDLFDRARVEALGAGWVRVLEEVVRRPEARLYELPVGGESAELSAGRGEEVSVWGGSFAEKFAEVAKARGDAPAVRCGAETVSYAELLKRARGCGEALREAGVKEESLVALLGQRGVGLVTAILGVWEAGGAYLPLDPEHPAKRVRQILEGSGASVVVVGDGERGLLDEALAGMEKPPAVLKLEEVTRRERAEGLGVKRARQALAYVIYTSGSTGEPKGVMVEEEGMVNHLEAKVRELSLGEGEVVAQNASQCFDISVWQMLVGLWVGGVTEVLGKEEAASPRGLMEVVEERGVTVLEVVPSMLKAMVEEVEGGKKPGFEKLRWLVATGEALSPQTCGRWLEEYPGIPVVNAYGPTECSDDVTHAFLREAPKGANAPVGKALPNLQTWVLGKELEVMPVGVPGELHVGGVGVGRGYLGRPDLTAERFVPDPYGEPGARLYRTGDLVKRLADGSVEYLGRVDHQVKVRGFRIELGEIEKVLGKVEGVKDCVVVALGEGGDKQLVGYVVGDAEASDVKAALRERLPEYMVPSAVVRLEALPLTANGKVDRKKLPAPEGGVAAEYVAPRSPLEELVAGIWARVLKLERVGATDNFFELGGHSLLATQVVSRLKEEFNVTLPIRALFEAPTVGQLALQVDALLPKVDTQNLGDAAVDSLLAELLEGEG